MSAPTLERVTDSAPRDAEYLTARKLQLLSGQPPELFGEVVLKEAVDNALDACEDAGIAAEIEITVTPADSAGIVLLTIADNGTGIPAWKVAEISNFATSTSDKAPYRSPTRGAQGNAWSCILGIPWALGMREPPGTVVIEAHGLRHEITPRLVLGDLDVGYPAPAPCDRTSGTLVAVPLPATHIPDVSRWAQDYAAINPHATFAVQAAGCGGSEVREVYKPAGQDGWRKWTPDKPTSAHWYTSDDLAALVSAHRRARKGEPPLAIGRFIRSFHGLTGNQPAARVKAAVPHVSSLADLEEHPDRIGVLLAAMQAQSRAPKPAELGKVPEQHYRAVIERLFGIERDRFWFARREHVHHGVAWAVDVAVAETTRPGRVVFGTNFGVPFDDPLGGAVLSLARGLASKGASSFLMQGSVADGECRAAIVHVQCAAPRWNDPRKVALVVPAPVADAFAAAFGKASKKLREERERAEKDAGKERERQARETRAWFERRKRAEREPSLRDVVRSLLAQSQSWIDDPAGPEDRVTIRDLYGMVLPAVAEVSSRDLSFRNFRQILAGYEKDHGEISGLVRGEDLPEVDLSRHPRGPDELKAAAAVLGVGSYENLLALSPKNDPYYRGGAADRRNAAWFAGALERTEYLIRTTMKPYNRGAHYHLYTWDGQHRAGLGLDGTQYANDTQHWQELEKSSKAARALLLVDAELFTDRRNKEMYWNAEPRPGDPVPSVAIECGDADWRFPQLGLSAVPPLRIPEPEVTGYDYSADDQPEVLFVLIEKSSMNEILLPLCRELGTNVLPAGGGYDSWTRAITAQRRTEMHRCRKAHIFYISDYDDAGENMPRAFARAAQYFRDVLGIDAHLTIEPLMLTRKQVEEYHLPKHPLKNQTELDALEIVHPGEFARIVRQAITARQDASLSERLGEAAAEAQGVAEDTWGDATADLRGGLRHVGRKARKAVSRHQALQRRKAAEISSATARLRAQIAAIEAEVRARYAADEAAVAGEIDARNAELEAIATKVRERWDQTNFGLPGRPEPEVDVDDSGLLYDSRRHWLDQLAAYKAAKAGTAGDDPRGETDATD